MFRIWAVARQTFAQCLRMKVAVAFVLLLGAALATMPFIMEGDGTLAGKIRTYLSYSTAMISVLLSLVTIFVSVSVVASDVRDKQIFTVAVKPIGRWQYILGRWLGVVMLDAMLLAISACATYALAQYLRTMPADPDDRRAVETEVFTARRKVSPDPIDEEVQAAVEGRIASLKDNNKYQYALDAFRLKYGEDMAVEKLVEEIQKQVTVALQSVPVSMPPGGRAIKWTFSGVHVAGQATDWQGRFVARSDELARVRIGADGHLIGRLVFHGPVRIEGIDGIVMNLGRDFFDVRFRADDMTRSQITGLREDKPVRVTIEPIFQITYTAKELGKLKGRTLYSEWRVSNPKTNYTYREFRDDPVRLPATLTVSARTISPEGVTVVSYFNRPGPTGSGVSVQIAHEDIALLYRIGGFEANFARGATMILMQLMFLAAMGVLAGSFLSFPVGSLLCLLMLPLGFMREFLTEALSLPRGQVQAGDVITVVGHYIFSGAKVLLPDFAAAMPGDALVDGMLIAWGTLGIEALGTVVIRTGIVLAVACLIFHRRELARVQV